MATDDYKDDHEDVQPRAKRFKHQSYNDAIKEVHLVPAHNRPQLEHEISDNDSHFHFALDHWRQLNLAPSFIKFANKTDGLSASMPLLLHNWKDIYALWIEALVVADDEGLRALLDLIQKMAHDLRTTLSPIYTNILTHLLKLLLRPISASALTALLETFSALFKFLLLPSPELLEGTWEQLRATLGSCLPEIGRAMAEVWGAILRRFTTATREKAVKLLMVHVEGVEDAAAWVIIFACKSASQTLHTATSSIFSSLMEVHLASGGPEKTYTLIRRTLTALIHHVKDSSAFAPLADLLFQCFTTTVVGLTPASPSTTSDVTIERVRRMLEIMSIPCAVRQGSRLAQNQLSLILSELLKIPLFTALHSALLKFCTAALTAAEMSLWLGPGMKFFQRAWACSLSSAQEQEDDETYAPAPVLHFVLSLTGALSSLSWGGWKSVALPLLLKNTARPEVRAHDAKGVLRLLASLKKAGKLGSSSESGSGEVNVVWRGRMEEWVLSRLESLALDIWIEGATEATELEDMFTLTPLFSPAVCLVIVNIIKGLLASSTSNGDKDASTLENMNTAWALGTSMATLATRNPSEWSSYVVKELPVWIRRCVTHWGWSPSVLEGLVSLSKKINQAPIPIPFNEVYPSLRVFLLSHSQSLRLATLRLLTSESVGASGDVREAAGLCLKGEEVSLDVQGVRNRVLRIGRVGLGVKDGDELSADIVGRWLIAQLKVNLRPIWSPAAGALGKLSERFEDLVWELLFQEVQNLEPGPWLGKVGRNMDTERENGVKEDSPWEEERSWRDPTAHKLHSAVSMWLNDGYAQTELLKAQHSKDRLDIHSYESQLLATLGICSPLAEKHNRVLVPHFLGLADPISKLPRTKLISWLTLFTKFTNPKALRSTNALHSLYTSLLSHPDRALQSLALTCLLTDNSSNLLPYKDLLRALLDETRFRDTLTSLDFQTIDPQARREVVNVIIRMLFGTMLERKGRGARGGSDRRTAVVGVLSGCTEEELALLVDLMLRPLGSHSATHQMETGTFTMESVDLSVAYKQRRGFLTLLGDVLRHLGPKLVRYWPALLGATVNLVGDAQKIVDAHSGPHEEAKEAEDESGEDVEDEDGMSLKVTRVIRQLGLKRLVDFFRSPVCFDFTPYMSACFASFISPRLASLDTENTQAPSALLELFYSWSADDGYIKFLVKYDDQVLPKIYDCLVAPSVKPVVIFRIFDIIDRLLVSSTIDENIRDTVFKPHVSLLLNNLAILVERSKGVTANESSLAQRQLNILSEIAQYSTDSTQASMLLDLFVPLLKRPSKFVSEKVKVDLLKIIRNLMQLIPDLSDESSSIFHTTYALLSRLFQSLRNRQARVSLVSTFQQFAMIDTSLEALSSTLSSLNAYSSKHMDEPDFDARLSAFVALNETQYKTLSCLDWLPLIYNMLHFIQDPAELAVRNNASFALRHFIDLVAAKSSSDFENTFIRILFPGLKNGLRSKSELVRAEVLAVIAYAVEKCDQLDSLQEMRVLLANGDEEANFFNNILHVQVHRRTRALRRLADHCNSGHLRSSNLAEIFVPLVGNYISSTASINHHLVNDAILTTGCMARKLGWGAYYALVQKYLKLSRAKDESERVYIRTLVSLLDNFHFPMEEIIPENEEPPVEDEESNRTNIDEVQGEATMPAAKASTMKQTTKIADAVSLRLLPSLLDHLEKHDASTDDNKRIPIAIGIVTVAKHLPATTREPQITRLLTILSQILRSKSQETRDLTRDTLNRIVVSLGSSYLPLLLRELRAALLRGPQLHVLAYVVHSLLAYITAGDHAAAFEILDDCVNDISYVSAEVIFGESGKDVQSEDFKTRMREVRSSASKGLDSFAMTAKFITPSKISSLLAPLKAIMQETASLKVMNLVEEVLKRVAGGLNSNKHLIPQELLVLCNTLITQNARFLKQITTRRKKAVKDDAIVQIQRQEAIKIDHYAINSFRFVTFGLDLFNTALRRNRFDFHDNAVMSRLNAMIVAVGNTLYSNSSPVLLLGMRSAAGLSKCPLNSLNKSLPVFVRQILDIIQQTGSTDSEVVQVALKSLATILRDGPSVQVKEKDLVYLLELLAPDLEDPERQVSSFAMLRAIIVRKFVVPEIYDLMDKISEIMVTNQSPQVQELCRGALLQFLLDYPQGKGRLRKQMTFFTRNLSYVHESGRKSVLELLSAIITKFEVNLIHDYGDLLFVALVMLIANDDSAKCREMASVLIKNLLARLDNEHRKPIFSHLHTWALQQSQPQLLQVSSQVYGFVVDVLGADSLPHINTILEDLNAALSQSADRLAEAEGDDVVDLQWQVPYYALIVFVKVLRLFPDFSTQGGRLHWDLIVSHLLFPHAWVRAVSCRLLGILFMAVPPTLLSAQYTDQHPLSSAGMREVAKNLCLQLKSEHLDEALSQQVVKNLFYIGKCFYAMALAKARDNNTLEEEQNDKNKEQEVRDTESFKQQNLLPWLFSTLSYQVKSAHIARRNRTSSSENWAQQPLAILRWFAAMATHMEPSYLEKFLVHILTPLYRLLEEDAINDSHMDELKTLATELQDLLQGKVGASQFSTTYNQIRQSVLGVRRDRKAARATQAVINPEAAARRRMHRNAVKKDSRKRKDRGFAERRGKTKRQREE